MLKRTSLFLLVLAFFIYADTTTVIMQNGLDGYSGCDDSWASNESGVTADGNGESLYIKNYYCAG